MYNLNKALFVLIITGALNITNAQESNNASISTMQFYVWDFHSSNIDSMVLLKDFTDAFEEALIKTRLGTALQRRQYSALFQQQQNETKISSLSSIPPRALDNLSALRAKVVIFGEVVDDKESGQIKISVNFESFDSRILAKESIFLQRGKRFDAESRRNLMGELVSKLFPASVETQLLDNERLNELAFFDNEIVFVSVNSFNKSENNKQLTLSLNIINLSSKDIYISFAAYRTGITLIGEDGTYQAAQKLSGLTSIKNTQSLRSINKYSKISGNKKTIINMVFRYYYPVKASTFDFSSEMVIFSEESRVPFSVGIPSIQLMNLHIK